MCTIRQKHMAYHKHDRVTSCTFAQRHQCRLAGLQDTQTWHHLRQHVIDALQTEVRAQTPEDAITTIHNQVSIAFHQFFPNQNSSSRTVDHSQAYRHIKDKWYHKKRLTQLAETVFPGIQVLFQAWHHRSRYQSLQRDQQRAARQAKNHMFQQLCQEVATAAKVNDTHSMFLTINKFSPKKPMARTRLRGPDGAIADQFMAHSMTVSFVKQMWQGPNRLPAYSDAAPGIPFSFDELVAAVANLHSNKSVAQPFLPGIVWKSAPYHVASFLFQHLQNWWTQSPPTIPQNWKDSWLFFLPKPGKPNTHPDQLRPISLMEPLGKLVMGLLANKIRDHVFPLLCQTPQFGFLPYRAATDAILRVANHSRCIRSLVRSHRRTVPNQVNRPQGPIICGGLSLFLDLTRAFDNADRQAIFDHLQTLQTPEQLIQLVSSWHEDTHYNLVFRGETTSIKVGRGLRQGCKIAPLLWVTFMDLFLQKLTPLVGIQWIKECITIYADDVHIGCQFNSVFSLQTHLTNIGLALDAIELMKLSLSYSKSFMLFAYTGTNPRPSLKKVLKRTSNGVFIRIPRQRGDCTELPLKTKGSYLGVIISYDAFEMQTWTHRKKASWTAFARLRKWLRNRQISTAQRLYIFGKPVCIRS